MRENGREILSLEERLRRAARSEASSPEAAVMLVRRLAGMNTALLFARGGDFDILNSLIGESMKRLEYDEVMCYSGFCRGFQLAAAEGRVKRPDPYQPLMGERFSGAMALLGLMMLDHARGRARQKEVYHCTRMTLGQYLNAVEEAFMKNKPAVGRFWTWRDMLLDRYSPSAPLGDALADILRQFIAGWRELDHLHHILCRMEELSWHLKREKPKDPDRPSREAKPQPGVDPEESLLMSFTPREAYSDPYGYYLGLAREYPQDPPDPDGEENLHHRILLPGRDFHPAALRAAAEKALSPEFRALLEENISPERLRLAIEAVDTAVSDLFMLWVKPYLFAREAPPPNVIAPGEEP